MNKFKKLAKSTADRINKYLPYLAIIMAVQFVISLFIICLATKATTYPASYLLLDTWSETQVINNVEYIYAFIISIIAAFFLSIIAVRANNINFYLLKGIKRSENLAMNTVSAIIVSSMISITYLLSSMLSTYIIRATHSDYLIVGDMFSALGFGEMLKLFGTIFCLSLAVYFFVSCMLKIYDWNKIVSLIISAVIVLLVLFFVFIVPMIGSNLDIYGFLYSPKGISTISAVILALSFAGYAILEMFVEIKR